MRYRIRLSWLGLLFATVLLFQNCSGRLFSEGALTASDLSSVDPQKLFEGQKLYAQNCALCHGDVNTSAKRGRSAGQIRAAIESVTNMRTLRLSDTELDAIAVALRSQFSGVAMCDVPQDVGRVVAHRLNRRELNNSLRDLFGFSAGHRLEAERMTATVGSADGAGWGLWENGGLSQQIRLADGVPYTVTVRAKADLLGGVGADMKLRYNNQDVQTQRVSATAYADYSFNVTGRDDAVIEVQFTNNQYNSTQDRNLYVDYVLVRPAQIARIDFARDMPEDNPGETFDNDALSLFTDISYATKLMEAGYAAVDEAFKARRGAVFAACMTDSDACAKNILRQFAYNAYRRPVTAADDDRVFAIYKQVRTEGDGFEEGLRQAMVALIVSPQFVFRVIEHPNPRDPSLTAPLDAYDIATRLSYFIWGSIPDGSLQAAAQNDQLRSPEQIAAQVRRMMADPRSIHVVEVLADQWLEMKKLRKASVNTTLYPGFSEALRKDMETETRLLVQKIFREDLPLNTLMNSGRSFLNARLAAHYGIAGFSGGNSTFTETDVGPLRRGILGHASVLTLTSHADETSIVQRGKYVLKNLLCDMPPPPPAGVINPPGSEQDRSQLRLTNPTCVSCHSRIDPMGVGLQNFNTIGSYRTVDEAGASIVASGKMPDGTSFDGAISLSEAVANDGRAKVCATRRVMNLALGRALENADDCVVNRIAIQEDAFRQPVSKLVESIALSAEFRQQRGEAP